MKANQYKNLKITLENKNEVTLKQEIGSGSFSNVYLTSNSNYVAKVMNLNYVPSQKSFINERKYYEILGSTELQSGSLGVLIIENCPKGSLVDIMEQTPRQQLSELQILRVIYEVAQGLSHIHKQKLIHRDIKVENILLAEDNHFKICDFGSITKTIINRIGDQQIQEIKDEMDRNTTPMYRAPEIVDPQIFPDFPMNEKIDIFALGVLSYILCFKKPPFESGLGAISGSCLWPEFPITSDEFHNLVMKMLSVNPQDRPSSNQIIQMIKNDLKFNYAIDGMIDPYIFSKQSQKEAKASWLQIINAKFIGAFFDTQGWIRGALQYDEYGPKQKYVRNLLIKAWKKRPKTDKFYMLLYNHCREHKNNTIINLKILILLHNYFKKGPPEAIKNPVDRKITPEKILEEIQQNWQKIIADGDVVKPKDQKRSQYTSTLIVNFSKFLLTKLKINQKYSQYFEGNFSLNPFLNSAKKKFKPLDPLLLPDLIEYLAVILKFVNANLLHQCQLWNIQATISLSILDEIYCLLCLTMHLYKTFKLSTNYESYKFDVKDITLFINTQDNNMEKIYKQAQLYFQRCSLITETKLPITGMIPKLPNNGIEYIKSIEILTNSLTEFKIFDHLSLSQDIYGLKLPNSIGLGFIEGIKSKEIENQTTIPKHPNYPQTSKQNELKPPSQQQNPRSHSANTTKKKKEKYDSDDQSEEGMLEQEIQSKEDNSKGVFTKRVGKSVTNPPEYKHGVPYIPNPHNPIKKESKNPYAISEQQRPSLPTDLWSPQAPQQDNQQIKDLFGQFEIAKINGQAKVKKEQEEDFFDQSNYWDPSHPNLIGYQKDQVVQKQEDTSKGQGFFDKNDLNRSVHKLNNKQQTIIDFDEQINIELLKQPSQQPHVTQPINNNPFDFWSNTNNNYYNGINIQQAQNNIQENKQNCQAMNTSDIFNNFGNNNNINNNNNYINNDNSQFQIQNQYLQNNINQMNQAYQPDLLNTPPSQKMNQQDLYYNQMQQQQYYNNIYQQQQQVLNYYNLEKNNGFINNQISLLDSNMFNQQIQQQTQNQAILDKQQLVYQQQIQNQQQQQYQQIHNPFINTMNQPNIISINNSPQMSPPKQFQKSLQQANSPFLNEITQEQNKQQQEQNGGITTQRKSNKQLIGVDDSEDEKQKSDKKREALKRLGSENIPDDESEALRPLDSFLGHQKGLIDPSQQLKRSISPFKPDLTQSKFANEAVPEEQSKNLDELKLQQCESKIRKHPELVNYIKNEVNSEFFDFIVDFFEIHIDKRIGSGNSCEVFKGKCKNKDVAIKVIKLDNSDEIHLKEFQREIEALIKLKNHENLLQLVAISSQDNNFYIVTEFCEGGTLFELLHKKKQVIKMIKWEHRIRWLKDVAKGMLYLHQNNLIHRDLKSLNLLFDKPYDPNNDNIPTMKIADFGLTRVGSSVAVPFQSGALGTFHWMAPETMRNQPVSTQADVYSFAIVMYELASRETPYKDRGGVAAIIKYVSEEQGRPNLNKLNFDTPQFIIKLMIKCWDENPKKRPKFDQIIQILENPNLINQLTD